MSKYAAEMEKIFDSVFAGASIDPKTGKLVESDPKAFQSADEALKTIIEAVAKEKWLMKESAPGSLADMAGLIKFEELNAGPSSLKNTAPAAKPAAGTLGESRKSSLGFAKVFEDLHEFSGQQAPAGAAEVSDGDDSFSNAQMGAGDDGDLAGTNADMGNSGPESSDQIGGADLGGLDDGGAGNLDDGMGGTGGVDDGSMTGSVDGDNPLDFDLGDLSSFDDLSGPGEGSELGGETTEPSDEQLTTGSESGSGNALV